MHPKVGNNNPFGPDLASDLFSLDGSKQLSISRRVKTGICSREASRRFWSIGNLSAAISTSTFPRIGFVCHKTICNSD